MSADYKSMGADRKQLSLWAKVYIAATILIAGVLFAITVPSWNSYQSLRFLLYFAGAALASNLKVSLPGITGTMSVNFVFVLIGIMDLNLPQVLAVTYAGAAGQVLLRSKTRNPLRLMFNLASGTISTFCCFHVYHWHWLRSVNDGAPMLLFFASLTLFAVNTLSVSGIIALTERKNLWRVWTDGFLWTASHHLVGAGAAAVFNLENHYLGWESAVLTVPVVYLVYRSYSLHLGRLDEARKHARELGDLHWRAIEALALAIDAKDETTHNHLLRVRVYATEISKELNLAEPEMQAIQAAALLHDIGKLAVPEYIISKPGKLTPEEFEKMKVHPTVGAEILERVRFPYPVVPIVRSHHEKWNGKGYPAGLKGEEIPIGARVLAAVDCLDALASHRQYRRALPLDEAMAAVAAESGVSFDPRIVDILQRRYVELEGMATSIPCEEDRKLSKDIKVNAGEGPASGYAESRPLSTKAPIDFLVSIGAARQEFQSLLKVIEDLGSSLSVEETLSLLAARLKKIVPHDMAAIFVREAGILIPTYAAGEDSRWFSRTRIPVGEGLTGWVVENRKPIINGNPAVEPGYPDAKDGGSLRSAISIPLEANDDVIGALTLYSTEADAFTQDHLRVLLGISSKAGLTLANAIKHQQTAACAATDNLTGLPNAKSLFVHLETELARASREGSPLALLVIDLDGFKDINDRFGHLRGNAVLQKVANGLRENCRDSDYVARMGGDEFVIVLPRMSEEVLAQKLERFQQVVTAAGHSECGFSLLGMSVGEALFPRDGIDAERLVDQADQRMYRMKQASKAMRRQFAEASATMNAA